MAGDGRGLARQLDREVPQLVEGLCLVGKCGFYAEKVALLVGLASRRWV